MESAVRSNDSCINDRPFNPMGGQRRWLAATLATTARILLISWGMALLGFSALEVLHPGFLRSEGGEVRTVDILPGVACMVSIAIVLLLPGSALRERNVRRVALVIAVLATVTFPFFAPGGVGVPFRWSMILISLVFYGLPAAVAIALAARAR
jgi:hypothetical protein